ncbi:MAG TPA: NAD(P)-dependent oxidoreductase [Pirellulales bacterium]
MNQKTILITGGYGCIGAETSKWLLRHSDAAVLVCSRSVSDERTQRVFYDVDQTRLTIVKLDITDQSALRELLLAKQVTHVIHLAALQTPDCNAHRQLGLQINLGGTLNVIEAMKAAGLRLERFIFASSIAVYGPRASYPAGRVPMLAEPRPVNLYGTWKLAGEHLSRLFCEETGVPTLSLRPGVLYGPGRDAGLTSSPTTAMKHVALGRPYEIPFRSRQDYLFAPDVGAAVGLAALEPFAGYQAFTLPSRTLTTDQIVAGMRQAAGRLGLADQFRITVGREEVPFICDLEYEPFVAAFPTAPHTPLDEAVGKSLEVFREHARRGWIGE